MPENSELTRGWLCWSELTPGSQGRTQGAHWARALLSASEAPSWAKVPPENAIQGAESTLDIIFST